MSKALKQVFHEVDCTGHHCMSCGECLLINPTDEEAQATLGETREQLSECIGCLYEGTVTGDVLARLSRGTRRGSNG
jgi:hypothetical protein